MKNTVEKIISQVPLIGKWRSVFLKHSIPGKWGSPIPEWEEVEKEHAKLYNLNKNLNGIDLNIEEQLKTLTDFKLYTSDFYKSYVQYPSSESLYTLTNNIYYRFYDGASLYSFIRHYKPNRIIEIGSGYSSALMLDVNKNYFNNTIDIILIEPNPERLLSLVKDRRRISLIQKNIQDIDNSLFESLGENDFLFVDSSHIVKMGNDVNKIIFEILPLLKKKVFIHFHDVVFPFEYPLSVIKNRYAWNESYFLHAFLMYNNKIRIALMNSLLAAQQKELFNKTFQATGSLREFDANIEGSIWLQKVD